MPRRSRLARLLRAYCLGQLLVALAWLVWRWPIAPAQAAGGALLVLAIGPLGLAVEFAMLAFVARAHPGVPLPSTAQLLRAWASESVHMVRAFSWRQPFRWRAVPDRLDAQCAGRTGVVLVHGFMCNRGFWAPWMRRLRERGVACAAVNLEPVFGPLDGYADAIDEAVLRVTRATGCPPVLLCHSMGGLAARAWWRAHGARRAVRALVTIGSPHGGTWMGRFSRRPNGLQMQLGSAWLQQLARDEQRQPLPPTTCWYSNCDNIVFPAATATLPAADNRLLEGQAHVALAFHPQVMQACLALVGQPEPACQGK